MNLFLMHRSQWAGLPGAPVTSSATFDSPIVDGVNGYGLNFLQIRLIFSEELVGHCLTDIILNLTVQEE